MSCTRPWRLDRPLRGAQSRRARGAPRGRRRSCPGGNTRSVLHFDPFPLAFARGEGAHLWSLDGDRYTDLLGEFTAGLYGHSHPVILDAIRDALDGGISYGGTNDLEHQLAELLCARFPAMELVRFTNSGTEANLMALALALHHTGRREILVFKGGYHGGVLAFGGGEPSPVTVPHAFVLGDYNDVEGDAGADPRARGTLGAILVEPMLGSGGCIPALGRVPADAARGGDRGGRAADLRRDHDLAARAAGRRRLEGSRRT